MVARLGSSSFRVNPCKRELRSVLQGKNGCPFTLLTLEISIHCSQIHSSIHCSIKIYFTFHEISKKKEILIVLIIFISRCIISRYIFPDISKTRNSERSVHIPRGEQYRESSLAFKLTLNEWKRRPLENRR